MTECQVCARKTDLYLCGPCTASLKDMLTNLTSRTNTNPQTGESRPAPGWIECLEDAALGRTRLGESARRSSDRTTPMPCNLTASDLLDDVHATLQHWAQTISRQSETLTLE